MVKVDLPGLLVDITKDGFVKIDGVPVFKVIERDGIVYAQFCDRDRMRSACRGTRYIEIPLDSFIARLVAR